MRLWRALHRKGEMLSFESRVPLSRLAYYLLGTFQDEAQDQFFLLFARVATPAVLLSLKS